MTNNSKKRGRPASKLFICSRCKAEVPKTRFRVQLNCCKTCWDKASVEEKQVAAVTYGKELAAFYDREAETRREALKLAPVEPVGLAPEIAEQIAAFKEDREQINRVSAAFERWNAAHPVCACCMHSADLVEDANGKYWCALCAYSIERCGQCVAHGTVHYPEIAAAYPTLDLRAIPREILASFGLDFVLAPA